MTASHPPVYAPVSNLMLYLTDACNLRCSYCFVEKSTRRMTSETARKAVEFFLHRNISGAKDRINITFFGGEPFLEMDRMEEVIAIAREQRPNACKRIDFSATTNGTICSPRVGRVIRDSRMSLLISMDGGQLATSHRPFISGRSSYDLVARNLPQLARWSPHVIVRVTFHPQALELVENVERVMSLGAPAVALFPVLEAPWHEHQDALEAAYQKLADWYIEQARNGRVPALVATNTLLQQYHNTRCGGSRPKRPCNIGHSLLSVDPDGNVMPCHRYLHRPADWLGTVEQPTLSNERWKYVHLSSRDVLGCDTCLAEPVCGGGCRVVAVAAGLDLTQAHPGHCITMRAHARAAYRIYETLIAENHVPFMRMLRGLRPISGALAELVTQ